jgi:hypothetical protein
MKLWGKMFKKSIQASSIARMHRPLILLVFLFRQEVGFRILAFIGAAATSASPTFLRHPCDFFRKRYRRQVKKNSLNHRENQ